MNCGLVRDELFKLGIKYTENLKINEIRNKDGIYLYNIKNFNESYVLKYFDKKKHSVEIDNYKLLNDIGVDTIKIFDMTENSILMEDLNTSNKLRLATKYDISKEEVGVALAQWYLNLHSKGEIYIKDNKENTYLKREIDEINEKNIKNIISKSDKKELWDFILENLYRVNEKINQMDETINYNDFYWTNFAVSRDVKRAVVFDYNMMGKGFRYNDVRNVSVSLEGIARESFLEAYGKCNEIEKIIDKPMSCIFDLIAAYKREVFPNWGQESLEKVNNGELERDFRNMLEALSC